MKLINGLFQHAVYAMKLEHDGTGLPTKFSSALLLTFVYGLVVIANDLHAGTLDYSVLFPLIFIAFVYTVVLRNQLTGLIILIGIISNVMSLLLSPFGALAEWQQLMLSIMEYVLVFGALTNVIKSNIKLH
jgi:hypothetical protein